MSVRKMDEEKEKEKMSKEKNLVFMNKGVPVVEGEKHRKLAYFNPMAIGAASGSCLRSTPLGAMKQRYEMDAFIVGPAIDRLYEFEKLGMEPEEIEKMMDDLDMVTAELVDIRHDYKMMVNAVYGLHTDTTIPDLKKDNKRLTQMVKNLESLIANLQARNDNQLKTIQDLNEGNYNLTDENEELKEQIKFLEETVEKFGVEESKRKIDELRHELCKRDREIDTLNTRIENQKCNIKFYIDESNVWKKECADREQVISQQKYTIEGLQKQIEYYQDKLERIDCILTEDDE